MTFAPLFAPLMAAVADVEPTDNRPHFIAYRARPTAQTQPSRTAARQLEYAQAVGIRTTRCSGGGRQAASIIMERARNAQCNQGVVERLSHNQYCVKFSRSAAFLRLEEAPGVSSGRHPPGLQRTRRCGNRHTRLRWAP